MGNISTKMKANELTVGDFFLYKGNIVEIVSIDGGTETVWIDSEKVSALRKVDELQPIPLTPEILEKNGFFRLGNQYNTWCMRGFNFSLDFIDGVFGYYEQGKPHNPTFVTKYVHELQHALELCGIEKTIEP